MYFIGYCSDRIIKQTKNLIEIKEKSKIKKIKKSPPPPKKTHNKPTITKQTNV